MKILLLRLLILMGWIFGIYLLIWIFSPVDEKIFTRRQWHWKYMWYPLIINKKVYFLCWVKRRYKTRTKVVTRGFYEYGDKTTINPIIEEYHV